MKARLTGSLLTLSILLQLLDRLSDFFSMTTALCVLGLGACVGMFLVSIFGALNWGRS